MIITEDTIWTSGSTISDLDTVEVAKGATLTIEGGVTVGALNLNVYGALNIAGTAEERVVFNGSTINSSTINYDDAPGTIRAHYFDMFDGELGLRQGGSIVDNGYFNENARVWFNTESGLATLSNSVFASNSRLDLGYYYGDAVERELLLENNSFYVETSSWIDRPTDDPFLIASGNLTLTGNNFFHDGGRILIEVDDYSVASVLADGNYFGTIDPVEIAALFYDENDSLAKDGEVVSIENRTEPNPLAPTLLDVNTAPMIVLPDDLLIEESDYDWYDYESILRIESNDVDSQDLDYALTGADAAQFVIEGWDDWDGKLELDLYPIVGLDYENPTDADGDGVYDLILSVTDGIETTSREFSLTVTDVNEAPTGLWLDNSSVSENEAGALIGRIIVDDPDAGEVYSFSIDPSDYDYEYDWDLSDKVEVVGDELRLKADVALDYETYDWGEVSITATSDSGDTISEEWIGISVLDVNEAPVFELPSYIEVGEHGGSGYYWADTYFDVYDPEWDDVELTLSGADAEAFELYAWSDEGNFWLSEQPDFEVPGDANGDNVYELTVTASDGVNTVSKSVEIEVTDENDAPEQVIFETVPVEENVAGATLGTLSVIDQDVGDTHSFLVWDDRFEVVGNTLKLKEGEALDYEWDDSYVDITVADQDGAETDLYLELDLRDVNEAPVFIDLPAELTLSENVAIEEEIYAWDPDWDELSYELTGPDAEIALFYPQEGSIEFIAPDFEAPTDADGDGIYEVTFKVSDGEFTVEHGLRITVADTDERPDAISLEQLPFEAKVAGAVVGVVSVSDQDAGDTHMITVSDSRFEVVEGLLKLKASESLDAATLNGLKLNLTATDSAGLSLTRSFEIEVEDPALAPTSLALGNAAVAENSAGSVIGKLTVTDPNADDVHSFTVSDDRFEVVGGALKLKAGVSLDHEAGAVVPVDVTAVDASGLSLTQRFDVGVGNANEGITSVSLSAASVTENEAGAVVGDLSVVDPDIGDTHSFTVSDDRFEVVASVLKLKAGVALDHEAGAAVPVEVTATDAAGLSLTQRFDVAVGNANEGITSVSLSAASVTENDAGAVVGQLSATDPDVGDTHSFAVSDERFEIVDGVLRLKAKTSLDFEDAHSIDLAVTATDAAGLSLTHNFTINVQDVAEGTLAPVDKVTTGGKTDDVLKGVKGNDVLIGNGGKDTINGGKGKDIVAGGAGADTLSGGKGFDTLDYSGSAKRVIIDLQKGVGKGGEAQGDKLSGFEGVIGSDANDKLLGSKGGNVLIGGQGADVLNGRGGQDWADYSASEGGVTVNLANRSGSGGDADGDRLINIERVHGSAQNDKLTGDNGKNVLVGDAGKDKLVGGGGRDELDGGIGRDKLLGGAGHDKLFGGEGNDRLVGGGGKDVLDGGAGNDKVLGGGGADTFIFDLGNDKLVGGGGRDTVEFDGAFEDYGVTFGKKVIVTFEDDRDVLIGMERLEFDDATYAHKGGDWVEL